MDVVKIVHEDHTVYVDAKAAKWGFSSVAGYTCTINLCTINLCWYPNACKIQGNWKYDIIGYHALTSENIL